MTQPAGPGRVAGNTVVVIATIIGLCCGLPIVGFIILAFIGAITPSPSP